MRKARKNIKSVLSQNRGMTLVEMLVAMAVLMVAIVTFLPLAQSSFQNIYVAGQKIKAGYDSVSVIEKLLGNDGANGDYETRTADVPLEFHAASDSVKSLKANTKSLQSIDGASLISTPETPQKGYSTFICDSVTAQMLSFPTHIADDFKKKTITLYGVGFHFASDTPLVLEYTKEDGSTAVVPSGGQYYKFEVEPKNSAIAYLILNGDNDIISFTHSPLYINYGNFRLELEIDAPTVIMVGEAASDGEYYYYVSSGEPIDENGKVDEENGEVCIIRKKMANKDPKGKLGKITLSSAMNDVEWVGPGEGDDGFGGTNKEGYYHMCGDNGQIRRFWKNPSTGNYGWGGDYTTKYIRDQGQLKILDSHSYDTTVYAAFNYQKPTSENPRAGEADKMAWNNPMLNRPNAGIPLMPYPSHKPTIFNRLFVQNAFSVNVLEDHDVDVTVADNMFYIDQRPVKESAKHPNWALAPQQLVDNWYTNNFTPEGSNNAGYMAQFTCKKDLKANPPTVNGIPFKPRKAVQKLSARGMEPYEEYNDLDTHHNNQITLTAVDSVKMSRNFGNQDYPTNSYTLYCGYIPAVMEIWATDGGVRNNSPFTSEWRATLGLAFKDSDKSPKYYQYLGRVFDTLDGKSRVIVLNGHIWNYGKLKENNFAISGVCGPDNYDFDNSGKKGSKSRCAALWASIDKAVDKTKGGAYSDKDWADFPMPMNANQYQEQMQIQNETDITVSYLSHPNALSGKPMEHNDNDQSPSRKSVDSGVFEWSFDQSVTIIDADTINYPDENGNDRYFSIAVGYYVGGLAYENQTANDGVKEISVPTVMNNGIVFLRSGGKDAEGLTDKGVNLTIESNVFNQFFSSKDYYSQPNSAHLANENTMHQAVSAGYWRDVYHPMFYSVRGGKYDPTDEHDKFNYMMSHIMQDKQLNCVCWGEQWNGAPEAMWGASDGTMMDWEYDVNGKNTNRVDAEFQSYKRLKYSNEYQNTYGNTTFEHCYKDVFGTPKVRPYTMPLKFSDLCRWPERDTTSWKEIGSDWRDNNPVFTNSFLDKRSWLLETQGADGVKNMNQSQYNFEKVQKYGFVSPLDTIEDLEYANDTWVGVGVQGLSNPIEEKVGKNLVKFCAKDAVVSNGTPKGSWVCVRTWLDQKDGADRGPVEGNDKYIWRAVQISKKENCNIQQISYTNGMWYAMGYIDVNNDGHYDYQNGEHAVMFYARDPSKACGGTNNDGSWDGGWKLCEAKGAGYTQAYQNDGNGNFVLLDIDGINSVASRND